MTVESKSLSEMVIFLVEGAALAMSSGAAAWFAVLLSATAAATWTLGLESLSAALSVFMSAFLADFMRSAIERMQCSLMLGSEASLVSMA